MSLGLIYQLPAPFHSNLLTRFNGLGTPEDHPPGAPCWIQRNAATCVGPSKLLISRYRGILRPRSSLLKCNCRLADHTSITRCCPQGFANMCLFFAKCFNRIDTQRAPGWSDQCGN